MASLPGDTARAGGAFGPEVMQLAKTMRRDLSRMSGSAARNSALQKPSTGSPASTAPKSSASCTVTPSPSISRSSGSLRQPALVGTRCTPSPMCRQVRIWWWSSVPAPPYRPGKPWTKRRWTGTGTMWWKRRCVHCLITTRRSTSGNFEIQVCARGALAIFCRLRNHHNLGPAKRALSEEFSSSGRLVR